jgi:hypothetical protein
MFRFCGFNLCLLVLAFIPASAVLGQTYYFVGAPGGDFFDENNWNSAPDASGSIPALNPITSSATNAIALDLIIDGDTVVANGQVDFGSGSLSMLSGSQLSVTLAGGDFDINSAGSFSMTDSTLIVDDLIDLEGVLDFNGGSVLTVFGDFSFNDDITNLTINGTSFTTTGGSGSNIFFDGFAGSISGATFDTADRLGFRQLVDVTMTDTIVDVENGTGDLEDVFATNDAAGSTFTLLGASSLNADSAEEGLALVLGGTTVATMGAQGSRIVDALSSITVISTGVQLIVAELGPGEVDFFDGRPNLFSGITGLSYADDPTGWNVKNWNGFDAVTLQIVPEPGTVWILASGCLAGAAIRRRGGSIGRRQ